MKAEPVCPSCQLQGRRYIVSSESEEQSYLGDAWFHIAHCSECGHVYGIFTKAARASMKPPFPSSEEEQTRRRAAGG